MYYKQSLENLKKDINKIFSNGSKLPSIEKEIKTDLIKL